MLNHASTLYQQAVATIMLCSCMLCMLCQPSLMQAIEEAECFSLLFHPCLLSLTGLIQLNPSLYEPPTGSVRFPTL